eukprot:6780250-Heterocapsa_arctica.AAC.1
MHSWGGAWRQELAGLLSADNSRNSSSEQSAFRIVYETWAPHLAFFVSGLPCVAFSLFLWLRRGLSLSLWLLCCSCVAGLSSAGDNAVVAAKIAILA